MLRNRFTLMLLAGIAVPLAQIVYYAPRLPERVASHFGPFGMPDGWMSKGAFLGFYAGASLFTHAFFAGLGSGIKHLPNYAINLPNKEYWLASERRQITLRIIQNELATFGVTTMLLLAATMQMVLEANRVGTYHLGMSAFVLVGAYLVYALFWCAGLARRFRLPK